MKPEYRKYLYQQELMALRKNIVEQERAERVFQFIQDNPALVTSTIYDWYSVSNLNYDEYHRQNLIFNESLIVEMEGIMQEYKARQVGLSIPIDELDSEYEI